MKKKKEVKFWNDTIQEIAKMYSMFRGSKFDGNISQWDVSSVTDMTYMLDDCPLENNPPEWYKDEH